jgi:hypothetical protein
MRLTFVTLMGLTVVGCSAPMPTVDAGPDTSCGLDCAAQAYFGLIQDRCFEYTDDPTAKKSPPTLGIWVRKETSAPVEAHGTFTLEGGVATIPVEYRVGGQILQTDYFSIKDGQLLLMRRIAGSNSVTYRTDTTITGVKWLGLDTAAGQTTSTSSSAFLSKDDSSTPTTYRVTTDSPTTLEKKTPLATYDEAIKVLFGETPDHGSDSRRVFVPGTGFVLIASPFNLNGAITVPQYLQRIRDLGTSDAGPESCSLGVP